MMLIYIFEEGCYQQQNRYQELRQRDLYAANKTDSTRQIVLYFILDCLIRSFCSHGF